jgi:DNA-binding transcriptional regulator GbsR (MarR family)
MKKNKGDKMNEEKEEKKEEEDKDVIQPLLLSQQKMKEKIKNEIVPKVKCFISIEEETKEVLFNKADLTQKEKVGLLLIGKYIAENARLSSSALTMREISRKLYLPITNLPASLKALIRAGYVEKIGKGYRVNPLQIEKFLEELNKKYGEKDDKK